MKSKFERQLRRKQMVEISIRRTYRSLTCIGNSDPKNQKRLNQRLQSLYRELKEIEVS